MNGIIFFEDGTAVPFGQITSVRRIIATAQELLPNLLKQERDAVLQTISKDELKQAVERLAESELSEE